MKPVKINHIQCSEHQGYTIAWAPDNWTRKEFQEKVHAAQTEYLEFLKDWRESKPPNNHEGIYFVSKESFYNKYLDSDLTIKEVNKLWKDGKTEWEEWNEKRYQASRHFNHYLEQQGFVSFYNYDPELTEDIDWNHHHGWSLDYDCMRDSTEHTIEKYIDDFGS